MDILVPLFWVIVIIFWIISTIAKKQAGTSPGERPTEERGYRKPEEALERFLRRLAGDEEIKTATPPFEPLVEKEAPPPELKPGMESATPPKLEEPVYEEEPSERREKTISLLPGENALDISTVRQGIILSEILGLPRGEKPF